MGRQEDTEIERREGERGGGTEGVSEGEGGMEG